MLDIRPNNSIYINNLNEKIKKDGNVMFLFCIFWFDNNSRISDLLCANNSRTSISYFSRDRTNEMLIYNEMANNFSIRFNRKI